MKKNPQLEGPKKHHDNHGINASVPAKGNKRAIPGEHWEVNRPLCSLENTRTERGAEFNPRKSNDRLVTYTKINNTDN